MAVLNQNNNHLLYYIYEPDIFLERPTKTILVSQFFNKDKVVTEITKQSQSPAPANPCILYSFENIDCILCNCSTPFLPGVFLFSS